MKRVQFPQDFFAHKHGRRFIVLCTNMAAVTSCENDLYYWPKNVTSLLSSANKKKTKGQYQVFPFTLIACGLSHLGTGHVLYFCITFCPLPLVLFLLPSGIMWHNTKHKKARIKTNYTSSGSLDVASGNYNFNLYNLQYPTYIT